MYIKNRKVRIKVDLVQKMNRKRRFGDRNGRASVREINQMDTGIEEVSYSP